jgi:hypothetical protein
LADFSPSEHLMQIKSSQGSKDYLPVQWRLVWFREQCPQGTIVTELVHLDMDKECEEEISVWNSEKRRSEKVIKTGKGIAIFRATVTDGKGGSATGTKSEKACSFPDFIEKAETGSIGRALAGLGYGTQFVGDELDEAHRIVDAPADVRKSTPVASNGHADPNAVTEQQLASIRKLCQHLGKPEPENAETMSYANAKELIAQLSAEYRQSRQAQSGK